MNQKTKQTRIDQLIKEIRTHPNKDELLTLMHEQLQDDIDFCITDDMR
jgi:hypothetical protein